MLVTRDPELARRARVMRLHGINRDAFDRFTSKAPSWHYEIVAPGFKYNMTDIAASMGIHQLKKANAFQEKRAFIAALYDEALESLPIIRPPHAAPGDVHSWHLYVTQLSDDARLPELAVFGNDYPTVDGTGVRDYIHVVDLAEGHLAALAALNAPHTRPGTHVWNLGTGQGYSVLQMVQAFEAASSRPVPYRFAPRRAGDIATCYADPTNAATELGWTAKRDLNTMMRDAWRWQSQNPDGYRG